MVRLASMHLGPGGYWHHIDRTGRLAVRAESLRVGEGQKSSFSVVDHNLEELRRTEVEEDILGGRNPGGFLVAGSLGSSLGGIGCMGLTC